MKTIAISILAVIIVTIIQAYRVAKYGKQIYKSNTSIVTLTLRVLFNPEKVLVDIKTPRGKPISYISLSSGIFYYHLKRVITKENTKVLRVSKTLNMNVLTEFTHPMLVKPLMDKHANVDDLNDALEVMRNIIVKYIVDVETVGVTNDIIFEQITDYANVINMSTTDLLQLIYLHLNSIKTEEVTI